MSARAVTTPGEASLHVAALSRMSPTGSWVLEIQNDGTAVLKGSAPVGQRHFVIPAPQLAELRATLVATDLERLSLHHHGTFRMTAIPHRCRMVVVRGERSYSISLSPFEEAPPSAVERREAQEALDVWKAVKKAAGILHLSDDCSDMLGEKEPSNKRLHLTVGALGDGRAARR
jgi:hypothetical protein